MGCPRCEGAFVSLLYYRDWAERCGEAHLANKAEPERVEPETTVTAMGCPKCSKLMTKYRITGCRNNRLDLCSSCDEAWLDGGEWELLKALDLSHKMPMVFTEQWQRNVRQQVTEDSRKQRFLKILGEADLSEAEKVRQWVKDHPRRADILRYLSFD
ncbi:hypothetical protein OLMES_5314 [Oleiphilus messinensis]|uniref:Transcription factor zinc-finger domain-containing protein n=2 Tax=Oleiphilus messinensis TaxID=141451 RepID=A0A1Y0IIS0_9GAMM|nr:hypothetical protein OLMES_5314 [Oleiphilus messinensis]